MSRLPLLVALLVLVAQPARAERGRFTAQIAGGVSLVHPYMVAPDTYPGGNLSLALDYGATDRLSLILRPRMALQRSLYSMAVGLGLKPIAYQGRWTRLYFLLEPELYLGWPKVKTGFGATRVDLAVLGGVGVQYLIFWGLGFVVEATASLPLGVSGETMRGTTLDVAVGLYTEF